MDNQVNYISQNILVIGNGFDLYHNLPTRYTDFLEFIKYWDDFYKVFNDVYKNTLGKRTKIKIKENKINQSSVSELAQYADTFNKYNLDKFDELVKNNSWLNYFSRLAYEEKGWIDFENEIEEALLYIKELIKKYENDNSHTPYTVLKYKEKMNAFSKYIDNDNNSHFISNKYIDEETVSASLLDDLKNELNDLIDCLNIYLLEIVDNIDVETFSIDISNLKISHIISFNYTNTYSKFYSTDDNPPQIHHIHGEIGENNNIVLGIKDSSIDDLSYVYFQKFFQRIQKKTGSDYKKWINPSDFDDTLDYIKNNFFIFGHSLDSTDGDIFKEIIQSIETNKVTIFYRNQSEYEKFVINLIKILGKDSVVDYVSIGLIEFKKIKS